MLMLTCDYVGMVDDEKDAAFENIVGEAGGEFDGSGCWLVGVPRRDLSAVFENEPDRKKITAALTKAGFENINWVDDDDE